MGDDVEVGDLMSGLVTEEEAAKMLGRSRQWLRNMRLEGNGPMYVDLGSSIAYYPHDVKDWLLSRRKVPQKVARKQRPAKKASPKKAATALKATTKE